MDRSWLWVLGGLVLLVAIWNLAFFTVSPWTQALVVQLGDPVRVVREPGLYWKIPFIQQVTYFDRRLLDYDPAPKEILSVDKQQLVVDNYSRWRIADPLRSTARCATSAARSRASTTSSIPTCARRSAATRCVRS